jgi:hypothetical protein
MGGLSVKPLKGSGYFALLQGLWNRTLKRSGPPPWPSIREHSPIEHPSAASSGRPPPGAKKGKQVIGLWYPVCGRNRFELGLIQGMELRRILRAYAFTVTAEYKSVGIFDFGGLLTQLDNSPDTNCDALPAELASFPIDTDLNAVHVLSAGHPPSNFYSV